MGSEAPIVSVSICIKTFIFIPPKQIDMTAGLDLSVNLRLPPLLSGEAFVVLLSENITTKIQHTYFLQNLKFSSVLPRLKGEVDSSQTKTERFKINSLPFLF